jgi:hypothetical protein
MPEVRLPPIADSRQESWNAVEEAQIPVEIDEPIGAKQITDLVAILIARQSKRSRNVQ